MTSEELEKRYSFCDKHKRSANPGYFASCLCCSCKEMSEVLSEIDYLINPIGDQEYGFLSNFDIDYDPAGVLKRVKEFLDKCSTKLK
jgi:hypothetical protein